MDIDRLFERVSDFRKALKKLREIKDIPENDIIRDATIQRFEFTYEMAWKTLKLYLESKQIQVYAAKDTLHEALQLGLIEDGNGWSLLHENRNRTSHTYDEKIAIEVYHYVIQQGITLLDQLEKNILNLLRIR
jgi:nucleotidyltransferase substrate binding protein (TIGR01987 family)